VGRAAAPTSTPKPRAKRWKKILFGLVLFGAVAYGLVTFLTGSMVDTVDRHFAALARGDLDAAYDEFSVAARLSTSKASFRAMLDANPPFTRVVGHTFPTRKWEDGQGLVEGTLELRGGGTLPISVRLVDDGDGWKILGYRAR